MSGFDLSPHGPVDAGANVGGVELASCDFAGRGSVFDTAVASLPKRTQMRRLMMEALSRKSLPTTITARQALLMMKVKM